MIVAVVVVAAAAAAAAAAAVVFNVDRRLILLSLPKERGRS